MIAIAVILSFILSFLAPILHRLIPRWANGILCLLPLTLFGVFFSCMGTIMGGEALLESYPWVPSLGVRFSFYLDGLSLVFALLITGIGTLIVLYSGAYLAGHPNLGRFYMYLLVFMTSMLGLVLAANAVSLFIFWELTSLSSYFLIGFDHHRESARSAALQALLVTGMGGLALLAGFLLLGSMAGSLEIHEWLDKGQAIRSHSLYAPMLLLILLGAFTKSAQFPFHFWLPSAMEGPAPVSAFLHSATMVKAGVYLLMRLSPVLGGTLYWHTSLMVIGAVTMIGGAWLALFQRDMKRLLAYTTVNGLGTMVFLIGIGTHLSIVAAVVFLVSHALYKSSLFLSAGVISHEMHSRDLGRLRGLRLQMPLITGAVILAGLSMGGLPPLLGFINKELIYEAVLNAPNHVGMLIFSAMGANVLLLATTCVMILKPFFGQTNEPHRPRHRISWKLWSGALVPAGASLVFGLWPTALGKVFMEPAATAILSKTAHIHLALWHGINPMFLLSMATILMGVVIYRVYDKYQQHLAGLKNIGFFGPDRWYHILLENLKRLAAWQTRFLQSGYLHHYIVIIVIFTVGLTSMTLFHRVPIGLPISGLEVRLFEWVIALLMILAAAVAVFSRSRLGAIVSMGVIGYGIALIFVDFGAPDLAMTQFIIETMTVILFVLVIYRLPRYKKSPFGLRKISNALLAIAGGGLMTLLVLVALSVQNDSRLSVFFSEKSFLLAHGRNIVNVIIVDFRAMDTLGEITVLTLAGIGVYTLLKLRPGKEEGV